MNERELMNRLEEAVPEVPSVFHNAMLGAFAQIQEQEAQESKVVELPHPKLRKRTAAVVLIAALFMASVALAAALMVPRVIDRFYGNDVAMRDDFPELVQSDVVEKTIGNCRVRLEEAVYDGVTLYFSYSVRNMEVDRLMGIEYPDDPPGYKRYLTIEEEEQEIYTWDAYLWRDSMWINGEEVDISAAVFDMEGGDEPGEYLSYHIYRLDMFGVELSGRTRITLPIGYDLRRDYDNERIPPDENGHIAEPEGDAALTFYVDADIKDLERVKDGPVSVWPDGTQARIVQAAFTPFRLYLSLACELSDEVRQTYPEGTPDHFIVPDLVRDMRLVDFSGTLVTSSDRRDGYSWTLENGISHLDFAYQDEYPSPLYLAPVIDGVADMTRKVLVKE